MSRIADVMGELTKLGAFSHEAPLVAPQVPAAKTLAHPKVPLKAPLKRPVAVEVEEEEPGLSEAVSSVLFGDPLAAAIADTVQYDDASDGPFFTEAELRSDTADAPSQTSAVETADAEDDVADADDLENEEGDISVEERLSAAMAEIENLKDALSDIAATVKALEILVTSLQEGEDE